MVLGWFVRLAVFLAVVVLVAFNGFTLIEGHVASSDDARNAAAAAASSYQQSHSILLALSAARAGLGSAEESIPAKSLRVLPNGEVRLTMLRTMHTVLMQDLPYLDRFTTITVSAESGPEKLP